MMKPYKHVLQLCPFGEHLEQGLQERFDTVRWFELSKADQAAWLSENGAQLCAVATGAHLGCSNAFMGELPALGIVAVNGIGTDKVDLTYAKSRGIRVTTTPGMLTQDTADLAVGLVIGLLREIPAADSHVRAGKWPAGDRPLARRVTGRQFGIVGLGKIGSAVAERLAAFGRIAYTGPREKPVDYDFYRTVTALAEACDVLVVTCPANESTHHLIDDSVFDAIGSDGYLINVARGAVVDEAALIAALWDGRIAGAALDVFEDEPNVPESLRTNPRVVLTPHMASATVETRRQMADLVLDNLEAYFAGRPLLTAVT